MWIGHRKEIRKLSNLFTVANSHYQHSANSVDIPHEEKPMI